MAKFKTYNVDLQSRLSEAKGQHAACESLLKVLLENKEAADTMLHLHDAAIKGCEKEKRKLERQMMKDTLKQINNFERAGISIASTDYLAGSFALETLQSIGIVSNEEKVKTMTNEDIFKALNEYRNKSLSPIRASIESAISKGNEVKNASKEIIEEIKQNVTKKGNELKEFLAGIDLKLEANRVKLKFMATTKKLTDPVKESFNRFTEWRKEKGFTVNDISETLKADRDEYKEKFAKHWDKIKDEFNQKINDIRSAVGEFRDYHTIKQLEAERQMNTRLMLIENRKVDRCSEKIERLIHRREKVIDAINKAAHFGNQTANKVRETLGYTVKEMSNPDASKAKLLDGKINKLEQERVEAFKEAAKYVLINNELTRMEKEISIEAMNIAREQNASLKKMNSMEQMIYNIEKMVPEQDIKEFIIEKCTADDKLDLDKSMAMTLLYKAGVDIRESENIEDMDANKMLDSVDSVINDKAKEQQNFIKEAEQYIDNIKMYPDKAMDAIAKDVSDKENRKMTEIIKEDVFVDRNEKEINLYVVEMTPEQNVELLRNTLAQNMLPEDERDKDFIERTMPGNAPAYAAFNNSEVSHRVFTKPTEAVKYADAVNRVTGMNIKVFGTTEQAKNWLENTVKEDKYKNMEEKNVRKDVVGVDMINEYDKSIKFKSDDGFER